MDGFELRTELERLHGEVYGWVLSHCGDPLSAEEILQNVYVKVLEGRARFDGRSAFKTWLLALIRNTAVDESRHKQRHQLSLARCAESAEQLQSQLWPDEAAHQSHVSALLLTALNSLPARQQEVLRLIFYHGLSLSEAADVMEISVGAVRTHYERGKQGLREWLAKTKVFDESGIAGK